MIRALLACLLAALLVAPGAAQPVAVDGGLIEGRDLGKGLTGWFGVPFAAPPLRELRWRAPQPVTPWEGVLHADRFAPMCLQTLRARTINHYFGDEATSEDCLYLNIWAPTAHGADKLPVIVWIYGGAFNIGSASMPNYSGEHLARDGGVVYVSVAYRVGPLGFLAHSELTAEGAGHSGNYGLMDTVAALQWVQRNIGQFGGDPGNVTIMGQSAGSMVTSLLQTDPYARGLFHRIVGMSGSPHEERMAPLPLAAAEQEGEALQQALGAGSLEAMRNVAGDRILAAAAGVPRRAIVIDGAHVTAPPAEVFAARAHSDVPVMLGFTRDERFADPGIVRTLAEYETRVNEVFGARAGEVLRAYPATTDAGASRALVDLMRDMSIGRQMFAWAQLVEANGDAPVYGYFFNRRHPYAPGIAFSDHDPATVGAYHAGEVPYFLRTLDSYNLYRQTRNWTAFDEALRDRMSGAIIAFARGEVPDLPQFDPDAPQLAVLGEPGGLIAWPNWQALPILGDAAVALQPSSVNRVRD
jgi:para-nitrobenzyl esterase